MIRKKAKKPSWNQALSQLIDGEPGPVNADPPPVARGLPVARRKRPPQSNTRKQLERDYAASYALLPIETPCAFCGLPVKREQADRHHPAGRRKSAFLFTVLLHQACHRQVHADPANAKGLLWKGRNSRTFTESDAVALISQWAFPQSYPLTILQAFSQTK